MADIQTRGSVSFSAVSMLTRGQIVLEDREGVDRGVVWTRHAPITKGDGTGNLADIDDVTVRVDGSEVEIVGINTIKGAIVLKDTVDPESEVEVDYSYTQDPILEMQEKSQDGNTFQSGSYQDSDHFYEGHFADSHYQTRPQPKQRMMSYTAWDQDYTTTFNDPTTSLFNQTIQSSSINPFTFGLERIELEFEGQDHPTNEGFSYKGPPLPPSPEISNGSYVLRDNLSSTNNIDGQPAYFFSNEEFEYPRRTNVRFRTKIAEINQLDDEFTGIAVGWASNENLIMAGFLEEGGNRYVGLLSDQGDESRISSYRGLSGKIDADDSELLILDNFSNFDEGDEVRVNGHILTVDSQNDTEVTLKSNSVIPTGEEVEVFPPVDYTELVSYQFFEDLDGNIELKTGVNDTIATIQREDTPGSVEVFQNIEPNQFFFGSISNKSESVSEWDFYRATSIPPREEIQGREVKVHDSFQITLPEEKPSPWILSDNQGFWSLDDSGNLVTEQGAQESSGFLGFHRIEPFLEEDAVVSLGTELKVESWADGFPAHISFATGRKEVTLGLFSPETSNDPTVKTGFGGVESFSDEGWSVTGGTSVTNSFTDHYMTTDYDGSTTYEASNTKSVAPDFADSPSEYLFSKRIRVNSYTLNNDDQAPITFGVDNNDRYVALRFVKDGVQFVDQNGNNVLGSPIDDTRWKDGGFHTYRVSVDSGIASLFIDNEFITTQNLSGLPPGSVTGDEFKVFHKSSDTASNYDIDYFFTHDFNYAGNTDRKVGIYRGGDLFDESSYDFASFDWLGDSLQIIVQHDHNNTEVFLDGQTTPTFKIPYENLPNRQDRDYLNTDLGYVEFGSLDEGSYSRIKWDYILYKIENVREDQSSITESRFNRAHPLTSPEPVFDRDGEIATFISEDKTTIDLDQRDYNIDRVVQVKSEDSSTVYEYTFDKKRNEIQIENATLPEENTSLIVTFFVERPHTETYLRSLSQSRVLYEETPYFPESDQAEVEANTEWVTAFNSDDFFNSDEDATFSDTRERISYSLTSEACPLYKDLDVIEETDDGEENLIAPAYDNQTFNQISFSTFEDSYSIPEPVNPGLTKDGEVFTLDDEFDLLDGENWLLDASHSSPSRSEVVATVKQEESESYNERDDVFRYANLIDYDGALLLDVQGYQLDDTSSEDGYGELDVYSGTKSLVLGGTEGDADLESTSSVSGTGDVT